MALGGGTFTAQNKVLPGTYINFISQPTKVSGLGERGIVALPIALTWGEQGKVLTVTAEDFQEKSLNLLGYQFSAPELLPFREIFKNASKVLVYNLTTGGKAAACTYATAKYVGTLGNSMQVIVQKNVDDSTMFDVTLVRTDMGNYEVDKQTVAKAADLVDNDFVVWKKDATLAVSAGTPLTGGEAGTVSTATYQTALDKFESYSFNVLVGVSPDDTDAETLNALFIEYTKRMRETTFAKFQSVIASDSATADYEGIVQLPAKQSNALYWAAGALAGARGNTSCTNKTYDGEQVIDVDYTQTELEQFIKTGKFVFHNVEGDVNVLTDINTFVTYTQTKGSDYSSNQVIRGMDMRALAITRLHNKKYIGKIPSNAGGRVSLWDDIVSLAREQEADGTLENYDSSMLVVTAGNDKKSTVVTEELDFVCAMEKLYMTITLKP